MNNKIEAVVTELVRRLMANNFKTITLDMKSSGDKVEIEPCSYIDIKGMEDIEYFLVRCSIPWCGSEKIEDVAELLVNYDKHLEEQKKLRKDLYQFFLDHIKGHTSDELKLGNDICMACYDMWGELPEEAKVGISYVFDKKLDGIYLTTYKKHHPEYSMGVLAKAYDLATAFDCYSDWYKDVNGYRPRSLDSF